MKKSIFLIVSICLVAANSLYGQSEFRPGYIINPDQDTIYGQIKGNSEARNARTCVFRSGDDADQTRFSPDDIRAYRFTNGKYYVSTTVEEDGEKKQVFLEYLVNGMANLYYLKEENSETYYIQKDGEDALAITDIRLLKATFSDCYEIQSTLDKATLSHKSLVSATVKYHDYVCDGEVCINYTREASRLWIEVGPVMGYSMNKLNFQGSPLFETFGFGSSQVPVFGLMLNLGSDRLGQHFSFQVGAEYSKHQLQAYTERPGTEYYIDYYSYDVRLESSLLTFTLGSMYAFSGKRIKPFLGGGLMFSKFIKPDFSYTEMAYFINWDPDQESNTWIGNPVANLLYGVYVQAGLDVKLSEKLTLFSAIKAGYLNSNPNTIIALESRELDQMRVRTELIPISFHLGILF